MKDSPGFWKTFALVIAGLLVLVVIFFGYNSAMLTKTLNKTRLEKETMLSENIHLNRNLENLKKEISAIIEKNRELTRIIDTTRVHIETQQ